MTRSSPTRRSSDLSMTVTMDADGHAEYSVPGNALGSRDNLYMRNQMIQTFTRDKGDLFQIKGDVDHDFDGFLSNIAGGVRYARRSANERRSEEHTSELQSLMRNSYAVFCLK